MGGNTKLSTVRDVFVEAENEPGFRPLKLGPHLEPKQQPPAPLAVECVRVLPEEKPARGVVPPWAARCRIVWRRTEEHECWEEGEPDVRISTRRNDRATRRTSLAPSTPATGSGRPASRSRTNPCGAKPCAGTGASGARASRSTRRARRTTARSRSGQFAVPPSPGPLGPVAEAVAPPEARAKRDDDSPE